MTLTLTPFTRTRLYRSLSFIPDTLLHRLRQSPRLPETMWPPIYGSIVVFVLLLSMQAMSTVYSLLAGLWLADPGIVGQCAGLTLTALGCTVYLWGGWYLLTQLLTLLRDTLFDNLGFEQWWRERHNAAAAFLILLAVIGRQPASTEIKLLVVAMISLAAGWPAWSAWQRNG